MHALRMDREEPAPALESALRPVAASARGLAERYAAALGAHLDAGENAGPDAARALGEAAAASGLDLGGLVRLHHHALRHAAPAQDAADADRAAAFLAEALAPLQDAGLAAARRDMEEACSELELFRHSAAHELRAPLRRLEGFSRALLEDCPEMREGQALAHVKRLQRLSRQMRELIDRLLTYSRVVHCGLCRMPVDLTELAEDALDTLRAGEPERRIGARFTRQLTVDADPFLSAIVVEALIGNAFKYTAGRDEAVIELGLAPQGDAPTLFVRDNGAGFDMRFAPKLFQMFQRLHSPREFEGAGIGLATARRAIERHGGRIWAEAALDRGASFYFTFGTVPDGASAKIAIG